VHHPNHHDATSIFVEKGGRNRRVFGAIGCVVDTYSLKYFLYFCYKFLQSQNFFVRPLGGGGARAGSLVLPSSVKNIGYLSERLPVRIIARICHLPILSLRPIVMFAPLQPNPPTVRPFATFRICVLYVSLCFTAT
jgi:hypothetical protein